MRAEIFSVGTELLLGQITDTNAPYLAQFLSELGVDVYFIGQHGDNLGRLTESFKQALGRSDIIIASGGIGPTEDDLTREAVAGALGEELYVDPDLEKWQREFWRSRGMAMPPRNIHQAMLIPSAKPIPNPHGTAPGWWVEKDGKVVVLMPGVPREMHRMWEVEVLPKLRAFVGVGIIFSRTLKVLGPGESAVEEMIRPLLSSTNPTIATYAKPDGIHVRITAKAPEQEVAEELVRGMEAQARHLIGANIYGIDDETLESTIGNLLMSLGWTVATMESCTGGRIADLLTDTPGASNYFAGSLVAYTHEAKVAWGVDPKVLDEHGSISEQCAAEMARAARERTGAQVGVATTGVLGPAKEEDKDVG
ncbi:MAG TPA: competence/damage-inducible protein A, partial [Dehalococcoidia bacterium]|nr:competence/damage-inducible protein A [Dehalococcoidia bacterium]